MIEFKHILCPIDFSDTSIRALTYATAFATWYEAQLEVLHVVPAFEDGPVPERSGRTSEPASPVSRDAIMSEIRRSIESVNATTLNPKALAQEGRAHELIVHRARAQVAQEPTTWCEIEEAVAIDRAYKAVLTQATASRADLIVMGAQGTGGVELMLYGSNTQHVLRAASCPVPTVHA